MVGRTGRNERYEWSWLCGDWDSSNKWRTSGKGEGVASETRGRPPPLRIVHRNGLVTIQTLVRAGWRRARPTSGEPTRAIPYDR